MWDMDFIIEIMGVLAQGGKVSNFQKSQLLEIYWLLVWEQLNKIWPNR